MITPSFELTRLDNGLVELRPSSAIIGALTGFEAALEIKPVGTHVLMGEELGLLETCKAAVELYAPVTGTIMSITDVLPGICTPATLLAVIQPDVPT